VGKNVLGFRFSFESQSCKIFENDVIILVSVARRCITEKTGKAFNIEYGNIDFEKGNIESMLPKIEKS